MVSDNKLFSVRLSQPVSDNDTLGHLSLSVIVSPHLYVPGSVVAPRRPEWLSRWGPTSQPVVRFPPWSAMPLHFSRTESDPFSLQTKRLGA